MTQLEIIKRNRKYFACRTKNGYKCKLRITEKSDSLEIGIHNLLVKDVSIRTKYGTEIIYEMDSKIDLNSVITLEAPYNHRLIDECRKLGGKWDSNSNVWVFSDSVADRVEKLDEKYNSKSITIELQVVFGITETLEPVTAGGFTLAKAFGRNSGANLGDRVALLEGSVGSGGSVKNWTTKIDKGSIFRMKIPELCLIDIQMDPNFTTKVIEEVND